MTAAQGQPESAGRLHHQPAPNAGDIATQTIASTPDLATLALSDKEFIIQNGKPEEADKVFATIKGKTVEIPDATIIAATDSSIQAAVSDDAVQSKTADFTFNMKDAVEDGADGWIEDHVDGNVRFLHTEPADDHDGERRGGGAEEGSGEGPGEESAGSTSSGTQVTVSKA